MKSFVASLATALLALSLCARAQEVQATVSVTMDQLSPSMKDYVSQFKSKVETYINEHRWTDVDFNGDKIPVSININFLTGVESGDFTAQIVVVSERRIYEDGRPSQSTSLIMRIMDSKWSFTYQQSQPLYHDPYQFNDLASLLDFYMYLVIGVDFDSMEPMQGTPYYQKAATIAQRAQSSNRAAEWQGSQNTYSRLNFINELMSANYEPFRSALYWYYYEGLDFMKTEKDDAQKSIAKALDDIAQVLIRTNTRSLLLTMWLESKSSEFCSLLDGYPTRPTLMNSLIQADPARTEVYRKCNF